MLSCGDHDKNCPSEMEINIVPAWLLDRLGIPRDSQDHFALSVSALLILFAVPFAARLPHLCLGRFLFGIPCPGCGILHSLIATARFDLKTAWLSNPAGIGLFLLLAFQIVVRPIALCWSKFDKTVSSISSVAGATVTVCLFCVWIERLITGGVNGGYLLSKM